MAATASRGSSPFSRFGDSQSFNFDALKNFSALTPSIQSHLQKVYLTLSLTLVVASLGAYAHVLWGLGGALSSIASIAGVLWLNATPAVPANEVRLLSASSSPRLPVSSFASHPSGNARFSSLVFSLPIPHQPPSRPPPSVPQLPPSPSPSALPACSSFHSFALRLCVCSVSHTSASHSFHSPLPSPSHHLPRLLLTLAFSRPCTLHCTSPMLVCPTPNLSRQPRPTLPAPLSATLPLPEHLCSADLQPLFPSPASLTNPPPPSLLVTAFVATAAIFLCFSGAALLAKRREYLLLVTAFVATAAIFLCFSGAALLAKRREYLYLGGFLASAVSTMLALRLASIFFGGSNAVFQIEYLYPGGFPSSAVSTMPSLRFASIFFGGFDVSFRSRYVCVCSLRYTQTYESNHVVAASFLHHLARFLKPLPHSLFHAPLIVCPVHPTSCSGSPGVRRPHHIRHTGAAGEGERAW
ncbi:unnamed protein product [Closterium sp. NIES-53]